MDMMKTERLYESQSGPIILSQIENECEPMEYEIGAPGGPFIAPSYDYDAPLDESVITNVQAYVFKSNSGACAAFLANYNPRSYATVALQLASLVYKHSS